MKWLGGLLATLSCAMLALSDEVVKPTPKREGSSPLMASYAELNCDGKSRSAILCSFEPSASATNSRDQPS